MTDETIGERLERELLAARRSKQGAAETNASMNEMLRELKPRRTEIGIETEERHGKD